MENFDYNNRPLSDHQKMVAKWLLYQKCIIEINTYPIHTELFKRLLDAETTPKGRAQIIYTFILSYHINEWFCIENMTFRDIWQFTKNKDFNKQFTNETRTNI